MTNNDFKLSPDSNIMETIKQYPVAVEVFTKHGIPCLGCVAARFEKLSDISGEFGISAEKLVKEIKEAQDKK